MAFFQDSLGKLAPER